MRASGSENFQNWRLERFSVPAKIKKLAGLSVSIFSRIKNRAVVRIPQQDSAVRAFNKLARTFDAQSDTGAAVSKRRRSAAFAPIAVRAPRAATPLHRQQSP
jgi:hypothetical protein